MPKPRWTRVLAEHESVLGDYVQLACTFPAEQWQREPAPGRWSAAALTLHVAGAYHFGYESASGGSGMRLRVPKSAAFVSRQVVLPIMLWRQTFPREAPVPSEVRPHQALRLLSAHTRHHTLGLRERLGNR